MSRKLKILLLSCLSVYGLISPAAQQLTVLRVYKTSSDTNRPEAKRTGRRRKSQHGDSLPAVFSGKPAACYSCWSDFTAI